MDDKNPKEPGLGDGLTPEPQRHGILHRLRVTLMAGITVIAPLWITGLVLWWVFGLAEEFSRPLILPFLNIPPDEDPQWYVRGFGFLLTVLILLVVGTITTNVV